MAITEELEKLVAAVHDVDFVVEGHGYVNNWASLVQLTRFHRALVTAARAAYDRGDPPGAAVAELQRNPEWGPLLNNRIKKGLEYGNTPLARAHMNVNIAYLEFAGEPVGFGVANGAPLAATDKHKGSNPADTAPPTETPSTRPTVWAIDQRLAASASSSAPSRAPASASTSPRSSSTERTRARRLVSTSVACDRNC